MKFNIFGYTVSIFKEVKKQERRYPVCEKCGGHRFRFYKKEYRSPYQKIQCLDCKKTYWRCL